MTNRKWKEVNDRKANRYAQIGLETEEAIATFLKNAVDSDAQPIFSEVVHHKRYGYYDVRGKDITVYRTINGELHKRSFGVTTSISRFHKVNKIHAGTPVFYTPVGFNPQHLLAKVLGLFN